MSSREPIRIEQEDRYQRLEQLSGWDQERLRRARVLVAGAGALGNEVLKNFALLGIGGLVLVDFDTVEVSNLSRSILFRAEDAGRPKALVAAERMREVNPDVRVLPVVGDLRWELGLGLMRRLDIVVTGLDSVGARLALNQVCWRVGKPMIDGGLDELSGIVRIYVPPDGACFECGLTRDDYRRLGARYSCQLRPREGTVESSVPTTPTMASIIGAMEVQEAVKWLHGQPVVPSRGVSFHGQSQRFFTVNFPRRADCLAHDPLGEVLELPAASHRQTGLDLAEQLRDELGCEVRIELDREVVRSLACGHCGHRVPVRQPLFRRSARHDNVCSECGGEASNDLTHYLEDPEILERKLCDLGIPPLHIMKARTSTGRIVDFELTGDADVEPFVSFFEGSRDGHS